jgi:glycosyl transferase family 87
MRVLSAQWSEVNPNRSVLARLREHREALLIGLALVAIDVFVVHRASGWGDVALYHSYATWFWAGPSPFHSLPLEYPAPTIAVFSLTLAPAVQDYATVFAVWMAAVFLAGYLAFQRFGGRRRATLYAVYLLLGASATLLNRFDLLPALLVVAALWAAERRRWRLAYLLLTLGALLKLYPALLLPLFVIEQRRELLERWPERSWLKAAARQAWPAAAAGLATAVLALALNFDDAVSPLVYTASRPLQVESTPASVLWLSSFAGFPALSERGFRSFNLVGPLGPGIGSVFAVLTLLGTGWAYLRHAQGRTELPRASLAVICVAIATSKVFSPQYLIWALPLIALLEDLDPLWIAICALTTLIYPILYVEDRLIGTAGPYPYSGDFLAAIAVRNLLFAVATLRLLAPVPVWLRRRAESAIPIAGD